MTKLSCRFSFGNIGSIKRSERTLSDSFRLPLFFLGTFFSSQLSSVLTTYLCVLFSLVFPVSVATLEQLTMVAVNAISRYLLHGSDNRCRNDAGCDLGDA